MKTQEKNRNLVSRKSISLISIVSFAVFVLLFAAPLQAQQADDTDAQIVSEMISDTVKNESSATSSESDLLPFCRHEFSLWLSGGFYGLNYKPEFGDKNLGVGGAVGLGYTFYFHPKWGIHTGAELAVYNTTYKLRGLQDSYTTTDLDELTPGRVGEPIDFYTKVHHYKEKQRLYNVNIPLMLQFQTPLSGGVHQFFASLGAKLGISVNSWNSYKSTGTLTTWAYYHYLDQWVGSKHFNDYDFNLEDLGYYENLGYSSGKQEINFKLSGLASGELGVKWFLSPKISLYTGVYVDYGFTNISKESGNNFFTFDPDSGDLSTNGILTSQYSHKDGAAKEFADKIYPLSFGLKLRLGVNMCKISKSKDDKKDGDESGKDEDPYRQGYRDAYKDMEEARRAAKPLESFPERTAPYYEGDPLLEAEMRRASAEHGKLVDLLVLYVDGYELNQSHLSPIMKKMIDDKIRLLQRYNSEKYIIIAEGHTCDLGREDFNMNLGQMRAEVVREYLMEKGFNGNNIIPTSKGETSHIVANTSEANRKINRRVVFLIKEKR